MNRDILLGGTLSYLFDKVPGSNIDNDILWIR